MHRHTAPHRKEQDHYSNMRQMESGQDPNLRHFQSARLMPTMREVENYELQMPVKFGGSQRDDGPNQPTLKRVGQRQQTNKGAIDPSSLNKQDIARICSENEALRAKLEQQEAMIATM